MTIAVFLVARDRRWTALVLPLLALLAVALMLARYHIAADVAGGAAVGLAVGIALCRTALVGTGRVAQPR